MYIKESRLKVKIVIVMSWLGELVCAQMYACTLLYMHACACAHIHTISKYISCITNVWKPLYSKLADKIHKSKLYESHWYYLFLKVPTSLYFMCFFHCCDILPFHWQICSIVCWIVPSTPSIAPSKTVAS